MECLTNQEMVQDFINDSSNDSDCAIKKKSKIKVVPRKKSQRLLKQREKQVVHDKKVAILFA